MNITYLREFIEVGLSLNLSKAAKTLHVSQPSLSKHIAALEKECGTELLKRSSSRVQLTTAGQVLFEESFNLIRTHDETLERIRMLKDVPSLNVGGLYHSDVVLALVNRALASMRDANTPATVAYQDYRHQPYTEQLQQGRIDVAFTMLAEGEPVDEEFESAFLFDDPMICLVKEGHAFAGRDQINLAELANQTILQPVGSYSTEHGRTSVREIFARHRISPVQQPVFVHSMSELATVANDTCVLIMERSMLGTQPFAANYHVLTFAEDDVHFSFYAVYRTSDANPTLAAFVKALVACAKK